MARRLTGDALLTAIDNEAWAAAHKLDEISACPIRHVYMPLFEHAIAFWRELFRIVQAEEPMTAGQTRALEWVATETRKRATT